MKDKIDNKVAVSPSVPLICSACLSKKGKLNMSRTYELVCHNCRLKLWIGQNRQIYTTEPAIIKLTEFLFFHKNHRLEFIDSEYTDTDYGWMEDRDEHNENGDTVVNYYYFDGKSDEIRTCEIDEWLKIQASQN